MDGGLTPGTVVAGRYELEARVGKGGFAEVWRARHVALQSAVAIKFLIGASAQSESIRRRFTTEAQVTAQLKSQNAVQVFDFGFTGDDRPFLVMELLEGETLGRRLERAGRLDPLETARLLGQSCRALHRAHQLGIVHRDFKPDNVVIAVDDEGRDYAKVVDFGIAKLVGELDAALGADVPAGAPSNVTVTRAGAVLGTPYYMAPEQVRNAAEVDLRADVWAFGVVAFECLTGQPPFNGKDLYELFDRIRTGSHPSAVALEPSVPPAFDEWFSQACASDPGARFAGAQLAYKALLVALGVGKIDLDPSVTNRGSAVPPRVVVHGAHEGVHASTIADERRVDVRHRSVGAYDSFRRLTLASPEPRSSLAPRGADASESLTSETPAESAPSVVDESPSPPRKARRSWPLVIVGAAPLVALFFWRALAGYPPAPPVPSSVALPIVPPAPEATSAPVSERPASSTTPSVTATVAPREHASSLPAPAPAPRGPSSVLSAPRVVPLAPPPAPAPSPVPSASSTAPMPSARPVPSALDPGSYR